ncbi:MAG: nitroreductase family protein [Neisseriaceae bacterium]
MSNSFLKSFKTRRTVYELSNQLTQEQGQLEELIFSAIELTPSAFNSQTSRAVILFGDAHLYLWQKIVRKTLRSLVTGDFSPTENKLKAFAQAYGTVLFFEDMQVVDRFKKDYPTYAPNFISFSEQSSGMAQLAVWTALATESIGASLQHYNPLIDDEVKAHWKLPAYWKLLSQLVFGSIKSFPGEKEIRSRIARFRTLSEA